MSNFLIDRLGRSIARWRQTRNGRHRLERLDDRMLADIGHHALAGLPRGTPRT